MNRHDKWIITALLFSLSSLAAFTQPRPDARCATIRGDTVGISWMVDNNNFGRYYIYKSYDNQTPVFVAMLPDSTLTYYEYKESLPITGTIYYWLFTEDFGGVGKSPNSDTVQIIFLKVTPLLNNAIAQLIWNPMAQDAPGLYSVYRQAFGQADWQQVATTPNIIYWDTITSPYCLDTLMRYRIEYADPIADCISRSTTDSATMADNIYPGWLANDIVQMDTVSVDFQGNVSISWHSSAGSDIQRYILYRNDMIQPGWYVIDSVPGDQYSYIDVQSTAILESVQYRVAAKDTCHAPGPGGFAKPFGTIFLRPLNWNYCDTSAFLQWDSTLWMEPYPERFSIYDIDTSTMEYSLIGETSQTSFSYQTGFKPDSTYCFFIRANNCEEKSSTSCIQCFYVDRPEQPDTMHVQIASVDTSFNDRINVTVLVDTVPADTKCALLRKVNTGDPYDTVQVMPVSLDDLLVFTDTTAQVNQNPYYYKTIILDGCDNASWLPVNEERTVFLRGGADNNTNHLFWNHYRSTVNRITGYRLYRKIDGLTDTIIEVGMDTVYDDMVMTQSQTTGRFSYLVEGLVLPFFEDINDTMSAFSNEIQLVQISRINMPNAFTPNSDGNNDYFGPRNTFTEDQTEYLFTIYNRWGEKVFESTGINDPGWDGTFQGEPSPFGVYAYFIRYVSLEGEIFEEKGTFTLLR